MTRAMRLFSISHLTFIGSFLLFLFVSTTLSVAQTNQQAITHRVSLGENLFRLSIKYSVELQNLREWNGLSTDEIEVGQVLIVGYEQEITNSPQSSPNPKPVLDYETLLSGIVDQVEALYYEALAIESEKAQENDTALINALFRRKYSENYLFELQNELNLVQMQAINDDIGLGFYSSFTHNFRPGVFDGEDLLFQNRGNFGLDWQLLSGGYFGRKTEIEKLEVQNQINDLLKVKSIRNENFVYNYNYLIYAFNKAQMQYIDKRLVIIDRYLEVASKMYLVRATPWEEIIKLKSKKETLNNIKANLVNYNKGFDSAYRDLDFDRFLNAEVLPVLEVIPEKVFSGPSYDTLNRNLMELNSKRLDLEYKRTRDFSFRTYLRYNMFDAELANIRTFGSIGATFTAPLFRNKRNQQLKEKELAVVESQLSQQLTTVNNELMNHYYEYEYTLKQYIDAFGKKEVALERLRREVTKDYLNDPKFTPIDAINAIDELYTIDFELLDLKQKLYLKLLKIYSLLSVDAVSELTEPIEFHNFFDKMVGNRSGYVWSELLNSMEPEFVVKYAVNNDFERLFVSTGEADEEKTKGLIEILHKEQVKVYRLIGNNNVASTGNTENLIAQVKAAIQLGFDGVQLDIEPHTFGDWDTNQGQYLANLQKIVEQVANELGGGKSLSVSLPLFYPKETLEALSQSADELVFMSYERPDIDFIIDQLREESELEDVQISLAIRTEDFSDRIKLEDFAKQLIKATGINQLAIHDLSSLIKLDQKTILGR